MSRARRLQERAPVWLTVGAATLAKALAQSWLIAVTFLVGFYLLLVGSKVMVALLAGRYLDLLAGRTYRVAMRVLAVMLALFALLLFREGLRHPSVVREGLPEVRVSAAGALTTLSPEDPETRALLQEMLRDGSSHVRIAAARGLWALKEPADEVLPTLIGLLHHKLASVRLGALSGLLEMGPAAAPSSPSLPELADDGNKGVRQAAAEVIRRIRARAESQP